MKYSYDYCYDIAKKYTEKSVFRKENEQVYSKAYREGWLKDYVWLTRTKKYNKEYCFKIANKFETLKKGNDIHVG